jgi:hypothetical protein
MIQPSPGEAVLAESDDVEDGKGGPALAIFGYEYLPVVTCSKVRTAKAAVDFS